ncbi:hypothetical protein Ddc_24930 [Ditylenchus destructor]|nr:hypothetical protein Ddc_24930 [Ditylenchus destructor]
MSCSKPLPPFTFDLLCYLNRDQLERFSIVCRPLKNIIERYFGSKPYRLFDRMEIRRGLYALFHNGAQWHPDREDYSVQQFLAGQKCSIDNPWNSHEYYSFAELRPYLGPTVRINWTILYLAEDDTYNPEHVTEMESMTHLWRDGEISIRNDDSHSDQTRAEDFQLILNSPTILQCRVLYMKDAQFSLKDYEVFYTVNVIVINYFCRDVANDYWPDFLEQPGVKPVVVLSYFSRRNIENLLDRLSKAFSSAVLPNAFKIVFGQSSFDEPLIEFREENKTSAEILELKKGIPMELQAEYRAFHSYFEGYDCYTLKRSSII